jgi:tRNA (guanine37-N1)-methyltransferase
LNFHIITIFPEMIQKYLEYGILSRVIQEKLIQVSVYDLRDFAVNHYGQIDSPVSGHGAGMLFRPEPLFDQIQRIKRENNNTRVVYLTPQGRVYNNNTAKRLSREENLVLISARYEGIDARVVHELVDEEISIGDYVLTGGEIPVLAVMDSVARFIEGSIKKESVNEDSFKTGLLEYEHYTEPADYKGLKAPEVLRSGNHKEINEFREYSSLRKTYYNRPDLLQGYMPVLDAGETKDGLKILKIKNRFIKEYLKNIEKIAKEWKYGRRDSKE